MSVARTLMSARRKAEPRFNGIISLTGNEHHHYGRVSLIYSPNNAVTQSLLLLESLATRVVQRKPQEVRTFRT